MNLTKGKITKLLINKKEQTRKKKRRKSRKSSKRRSLKRKSGLDLANKTLRNLVGGQLDSGVKPEESVAPQDTVLEMPSPATPVPATPVPTTPSLPEDDELKQMAGIVTDITNVGNTNDDTSDGTGTMNGTDTSDGKINAMDDGLGQEWWDDF